MLLSDAIELREAAFERLRALKAAASSSTDGMQVQFVDVEKASKEYIRWDREVARLSGSRPTAAQINLGGF